MPSRIAGSLLANPSLSKIFGFPAAEFLGKTDEAIDHYRKAVELKPTAADIHGNLGVALEYAGDLEGAIQQLRLALQYGDNPKDRARYQSNLDRVEKALRER